MKRQDRIEMQVKGDEAIRKSRAGKTWIIKTDSMNTRARKIGIATDIPSMNRASRRRELKVAVSLKIKAIKKGVPE